MDQISTWVFLAIMIVSLSAIIYCILKEKKGLSRKKTKQAYIFMFPVIISLLFVFGYPLINSFIMAFQNYKLTAPNDIGFNGGENFKNLFGDKDTMLVMKNTVIYLIVSVVGQFVIGISLAMGLKKKFKGRGLYQAVVFLPWAFSGYVIGLMFRWAFNGEYGVVNDLLLKTGIITEKISWLGTPGWSLAVVIMATIWIGFPFFSIMLLAALQSIPQEIYEAADVDGCGAVRRFIQITLPYLKPTIMATVLLRTIWTLNSFDLVVIITGGGPANTSNTLPSYMYTRAFANFDFGFASALGVTLMVLISVCALVIVILPKFMKKGENL